MIDQFVAELAGDLGLQFSISSEVNSILPSRR